MKAFCLSLALALLATPLFAQVNPLPNKTVLVMGLDVANGIVAPAGPSRVSVPPGESVTMMLSAAPAVPIQWTKDGTPIPGATGQTYVIGDATAAHGGRYSITGFAFPTVATGIDLNVETQGNLSNVSARVALQATGSQVVGFVVSGTKSKTLLFRAVGPTLAKFGITSPASQPRVRCYDAQGHDVSFVHPAVVIDVNALFQSVGAFPVDTTELPTLSYDYGPFAPGSYTLVVDDATRTGGSALVEVYEMGN
ncbi:MAG TPA: immunoglobulin domain-containing protein [Opitutaceae bacterium]|nr:immunoglobulin domain-containing protein [Opitutaceae bacterium]